jgi:hypothetical protein
MFAYDRCGFRGGPKGIEPGFGKGVMGAADVAGRSAKRDGMRVPVACTVVASKSVHGAEKG